MFSEIFKPIHMQDKFNINNTSFKHSLKLNKNRVQIMCTYIAQVITRKTCKTKEILSLLFLVNSCHITF